MKKNYFLLALAAAGMMSLASCSSSEDVGSIKSVKDEGVQQLVIQIASSGDGLQSRAGRPLYGSDAAQDIQNVKVVIKNDENKVVYANLIDEWMDTSSEYNSSGHGRQYVLALKGEDKLSAGSYKIVAVGYSTSSDYTYNPTLESLTKDATLSNDITATLATGKDAEEVFAGEAEVNVGDDLSFSAAVTLHRQVAGAIGYFTKIPSNVNGTPAASLRLVTSSKNIKLTFENLNSEFTETGSNVKYIVNGSEPATADAEFNGSASDDAHVLYSINLADWFTADDNGSLDKNNDGFLDENDDWKHPAGVNTVLTKGSVLAGKFIIPFALTESKITMELQLLATNGTILRSWGVNIPQADLASEKTAPEVNDNSVSIFNIVRNHMYNLGVKTTHTPAQDTDGDGDIDDDDENDDNDPEPDDNDDDDDEPQDLSKAQELILKVNDNWELIHKMELD